MFASQKLAELAAQKRVLLLESELNRRVLAVHWTQAGAPLRRWRGNLKTLSGLRPYWGYLAPIAGFMFVRRRSDSRGGLLAKIFFWWRLGRRAWRLWRLWETWGKKA